MMMNEIEQKLEDLAKARMDCEDAKKWASQTLEELKAGDDEYQGFIQDVQRNAALVEKLEAEIKSWAIANYDGKNKTVHPKVKIASRDRTTVTYNPARAHGWCLTNFTPALVLDKKTFEKAALAGTIPADIAEVVKASEDVAQIATDLSDYL